MSANTSLQRIMQLKIAVGVMLAVGVIGCVAWAAEQKAPPRSSTENPRSAKAETPRFMQEALGNALVSCVRGCQDDLGCLRDCAAPSPLDDANADEGFLWTPEPRVTSHIREALENVSLCSDRYLGPGREDVDPESHGVCVWVATGRFLVQAGWGKNSSQVPSRASGYDIRKAVELIMTVADISRLAALDARTAQASEGDVAGGENGPEPAEPTFAECLDQLDANLAECNRRYAGPDGDTGRLNTCLDAANGVLITCTGATPAV